MGEDRALSGGKRVKKVILFVLLSALFFGTMEVALKLAGNTLDALQITFLRFFIGGLMLLPFAIRENRRSRDAALGAGNPPPAGAPAGGPRARPLDPNASVGGPRARRAMTGKMWLYMLLLGAVNVPFGMILFQFGVMRSNAATAAVLFSCNPVFTMLFAHFFTSGDRMNRRKALALAVGAAGLVLMVRPWGMQPGNTFAGAFLSIAAAAVFGLYSVLGGKTVGRVGAFTQTSASFLIGSLILLAFLSAAGRPILAGSADNLVILLYTSIVVTGGGYLFYFLAIKHSNATTASTVFFLKPVIAPVFAVLILHESITFNMYAGIAFILLASYILNRRLRKGDAAG
jgi:drug/metabolite transporter (DMT)-like permease